MRGFRLGERSIDLVAGAVTSRHQVERLTPNEAKLLRYLARRSGELVGRDELMTDVWGYRPSVVSRTIDTTVRRLRIKIEPDPSTPVYLQALYNQGLRLDGVEPLEPESPTTSFVGRESTLVELVAAIRRAHLVTVWGPAGVGKSRLASEVEARLPMESIRVSCADVRDGGELDRRVAAALGAEPGATIGVVLGARGAALLVLDECESAVELVGRRVESWRTAAPRLKVLATSRVALGLPGEQEFPLAPLDDEAALALFVQRVSLRDPQFEVPAADARRVVAALDGLPLALELAAARAPLLGLPELARMLDTPLDVLGGRGRTSMAQVLERSWSLLSTDEREVLTAAAVFESPFDLTDLAAVAGIGRAATLDRVEALVGSSMMHRVAGEQRYKLLHVVRARARASLDPAAVARHARWYAQLGDPDTFSERKADRAGRERLVRAVPELWAAYAAATDPEDRARCGLVLVWALGSGGLRQGLALAPALASIPCSRGLQHEIALEVGTLQQYHGDLAASTATFEALLPGCDEPRRLVRVLTLLSVNRQRLGELAHARRLLDAARPHVADAAGEGAWFWIACAMVGDTPDASEQAAAEAVTVAQRHHVPKAEAMALSRLAFFGVTRRGDWAAGRRLYLAVEELCDRFALSQGPRSEAVAGRGLIELAVGDLDAAESLLEQAVAISDAIGQTRNTAVLRLFLARVWAARGQLDDAVGLVEQTLGEPASHPHRGTALRHVVTAELALERGDRAVARRAAEQAIPLCRAFGWGNLEAEALELLAVIDLDPDRLAAAAALDASEPAPARRCALAALVAAERGDHAAAQRELARGEDLADALGLLPPSAVRRWLDRARRALRS